VPRHIVVIAPCTQLLAQGLYWAETANLYGSGPPFKPIADGDPAL